MYIILSDGKGEGWQFQQDVLENYFAELRNKYAEKMGISAKIDHYSDSEDPTLHLIKSCSEDNFVRVEDLEEIIASLEMLDLQPQFLMTHLSFIKALRGNLMKNKDLYIQLSFLNKRMFNDAVNISRSIQLGKSRVFLQSKFALTTMLDIDADWKNNKNLDGLLFSYEETRESESQDINDIAEKLYFLRTSTEQYGVDLLEDAILSEDNDVDFVTMVILQEYMTLLTNSVYIDIHYMKFSEFYERLLAEKCKGKLWKAICYYNKNVVSPEDEEDEEKEETQKDS